ncbi:RteC domain-containing protein [Pedobacter miscanthi]|uniref:RteC domain-containing protein n=1 Tax=Pedobacter miscanthi TaxID=2259170 RepID=UPI002930E4F4|nr:RteC domain-containing protein [Pedobacter miscanthi]
MIKKLSSALYTKMKAELEKFNDDQMDKMDMLKNAVLTVHRYLDELKQIIEKYPFADEDEEIWFFKTEKPMFYRWLIFYTELLNIDSTRPLGEGKRLNDHYREQVRYINRFLRSHEFQYQYFRLGNDELDHLFFLRGASSKDIRLSSVPTVDPSFGTGHEYLFSKFRACELLQDYLKRKLSARKGLTAENAVVGKARMKWTGESLNLIEILYALHGSGQINNGRVELSEIAAAFQQLFQVNLSRYFRRFAEIKQRKGMSKTRFLDQMREVLIKKIEEADAYRP